MKSLFLSDFECVDLMTGGDIQARLDVNVPELNCSKLILAEIIVALETLHTANILYSDVHGGNILIDCSGHLVLCDFGFAKSLSDNNATRVDWKHLCALSYFLFSFHDRSGNEESIMKMLWTMTDEQLPSDCDMT